MAVYTQAVLSPDPLYLQSKGYDARSDRKWFADLASAGILNAGDYLVSWTSAMGISIAGGVAYILGQNVTDQGMYREYTPNTTALTVTAAHATLPRIDTVILRVMDNANDGSGFDECRIEIVPGTATTGATLANALGAANLTTLGEASKSVLPLAYVLVPAAAVALSAANLRDLRTRLSVGLGTAQSAGFPIGGTLEWNSPTMPAQGSWLVEDGSAISRTTFAIWFGIVGTRFGAGDGTTTANLPDSRGRAAYGYAPSGGHAEMNAVGNNDGVALASRRVRHKHTGAWSTSVGAPTISAPVITISDPTHAHGYTSPNGTIASTAAAQTAGGTTAATTAFAATGITATSSAPVASAPAATTTGTVGPQTGAEPTDMTPYICKNKIQRVA